jgi:hypothetical protein
MSFATFFITEETEKNIKILISWNWWDNGIMELSGTALA